MAAVAMAPLMDMDSETARLVLEMQLEDVASTMSNSKGKNRENEPGDLELSFRMYQQELEATLLMLKDHSLCESIARAVHADQEILRLEAEAERAAERDRRYATALQGSTGMVIAPEVSAATSKEDEMDDEYFAKLAARYHSEQAAMPYLEQHSTVWSSDERLENRRPERPGGSLSGLRPSGTAPLVAIRRILLIRLLDHADMITAEDVWTIYSRHQ